MINPKKRTWNKNSVSFFQLNLIPNHPEINTKTLTQIMENDSVRNLKNVDKGAMAASATVGADRALKFACTIITSIMVIILSNSTLDCLNFLVISIIIISPTNFTNNHEYLSYSES